MTLKEMIEKSGFAPIHLAEDLQRQPTKVFCCDLLSIAMAKAPADCVWVTVMGNINTIAVGVLTDVACIILAEGIDLDEASLARAQQQGVTVLKSELPIFDAGLIVNGFIHE